MFGIGKSSTFISNLRIGNRKDQIPVSQKCDANVRMNGTTLAPRFNQFEWSAPRLTRVGRPHKIRGASWPTVTASVELHQEISVCCLHNAGQADTELTVVNHLLVNDLISAFRISPLVRSLTRKRFFFRTL